MLPPTLHQALELAQPLRYGENPHQQGARYRRIGARSWWDGAVQHGGKELSYLNLYDAEAAWRLVHRLGEQPAAVVIKHANPCGAAVAGDITTAYQRAHAGDPVSAFGGIVALNRPVPLALAEALAPVFTEVVVAPGFDDDALALLTAKKNLRVLTAPPPGAATLDLRTIDGGALVQEVDQVGIDRAAWRVVTKVAPTEEQWVDLELAWRVCAAVSSNAIVLVQGGQAVGIGAGQQNRLDSARIAVEKAAGRAAGGACASDAFFPFRDGVDAVAASGVRGGHPARRFRPRRGGHRRRRRARPGHGLHRRAPLPPLSSEPAPDADRRHGHPGSGLARLGHDPDRCLPARPVAAAGWVTDRCRRRPRVT